MVGIARYGSYIPTLRLDRRCIEQAWGARHPKGEVAVANYDEDALTLAIEAAMSCLGDPPAPVGGAFVATTSPPYAEKQLASVLATACDLPRAIFTADFAGSARAGVSATLAAVRAVQAGAAPAVLVAAADVRLASPESELEGVLGDGAAALTIADRDVIAEFVDAASVAEEFTYVWRTDAQRTVQVAGGRFSNTYGYGRDLGLAIRTLLERRRLEPASIAALALYSPDARASAELAKSLGFDPKTQLVEPVQPQIGCAGSAEPLLLLARALDRAQPGQFILVAGYGEGADVLLLRVTDVVANVLEFKELKQDVRLYGSRCRECGQVQYPMARVCIRCQAQDRLEDT